jgi:hypothetical protein
MFEIETEFSRKKLNFFWSLWYYRGPRPVSHRKTGSGSGPWPASNKKTEICVLTIFTIIVTLLAWRWRHLTSPEWPARVITDQGEFVFVFQTCRLNSFKYGTVLWIRNDLFGFRIRILLSRSFRMLLRCGFVSYTKQHQVKKKFKGTYIVKLHQYI